MFQHQSSASHFKTILGGMATKNYASIRAVSITTVPTLVCLFFSHFCFRLKNDSAVTMLSAIIHKKSVEWACTYKAIWNISTSVYSPLQHASGCSCIEWWNRHTLLGSNKSTIQRIPQHLQSVWQIRLESEADEFWGGNKKKCMVRFRSQNVAMKRLS